MPSREEYSRELHRNEMFPFPPKWWWDPVPDWFRVIDKEQWFQFAELEIELRKRELEIQEQRIKGLQNIIMK